MNRVVPRAQLDDAVMTYARRIAENDPFQLRMTKLAVNQMQDGQGFQAHITAAHLMHLMSSAGEADPDYALRVPDGRRRPMVAEGLRALRGAQGRAGRPGLTEAGQSAAAGDGPAAGSWWASILARTAYSSASSWWRLWYSLMHTPPKNATICG